MDTVAQQLPQIITAAAQSQLGILALLVVSLAGLAYFFFARASEKARLGVFVLLFAGVVGFAYAMFQAAPGEAAATAPAGATGTGAFDSASLSAEARALLREAAADPAGVVTYVHYGTGPELTAGERSMLPDRSRRTVATWEAALQELTAAGLLAGRGENAEIFDVTAKGFDVAARIEAR